jgi:hypothetical protein
MFRTARGFLIVAPPAFLAGLIAFLAVHPQALESYTVYPMLSDVLGSWIAKRPLARFVATSALFFLVPYLVTGLLLFFADLGLAAATPLWTGKKSKVVTAPVPLEARVAFTAGSVLSAGAAGVLLHKVAHGGELAGRISVAPLMAAAIPFGALAAGLLLGAIVGLPRLLVSRLSPGPRGREGKRDASV